MAPRPPTSRWDSHLEVYWSQRCRDEMYQASTEYTVESQDLTKLATTDE